MSKRDAAEYGFCVSPQLTMRLCDEELQYNFRVSPSSLHPLFGWWRANEFLNVFPMYVQDCRSTSMTLFVLLKAVIRHTRDELLHNPVVFFLIAPSRTRHMVGA